jgi:putative YhbY family RNA-binding protein
VIGDELSAKERATLRARAHGLKPVVWVAESGITPGAIREVDRALAVHELIKIHAAIDGRDARTALLADICTTLGAQPVQVIGKMLVAFRRRPERVKTTDRPAAAIPTPRRKTRSRQRSAGHGSGKQGRNPGFKRI